MSLLGTVLKAGLKTETPVQSGKKDFKGGKGKGSGHGGTAFRRDSSPGSEAADQAMTLTAQGGNVISASSVAPRGPPKQKRARAGGEDADEEMEGEVPQDLSQIASLLTLVMKNQNQNQNVPNGQKKGNQQRKGKMDYTNLQCQKTVPAIHKGMVTLFRKYRQLAGMLITYATAPMDIPLAVPVLKAGTAYHEQAQGKHGHGLGSALLYVVTDGLKALTEHLRSQETVPQESRPLIDYYEQHLKIPEDATPEAIKEFMAKSRATVEAKFDHFKVIELKTENLSRTEFRILDDSLKDSFENR